MDAKRAQLSCIEGQLTKYKQNLEKEVSKASKLQVELEREVLQRNKVVDQLQQKDNGTIFYSYIVKQFNFIKTRLLQDLHPSWKLITYQ